MQRIIAAAAGLAAALTAGGALAQAPVAQDIYSFSYTLASGITDSGMLTGTLQSNGSTFDITGVKSFTIGGVSYSAPLIVESTDEYAFGNSSSPVADLSKSLIDFSVLSQDRQHGFSLGVGDQTAAYFGGDIAAATSDFGGSGNIEDFNSTRYTASVTPAGGGGGGGGPEPSTWALMMVGVFGAGAALRRRQGEDLAASAV